jgi:hypothetical protein
MIFFNDKKLAIALRDGTVTERQRLFYLVITNFLYSLCATCTVGHYIWRQDLNFYNYLNDAISLTFVIFIVMYAFSINKAGDSRDFTSRYICITVPIGVKTMILSFVIGIPACLFTNRDQLPSLAGHKAALAGSIATPVHFVAGWPDTTALLLVFLYFWNRIRVSFKIVSGQSDGSSSALSVFGTDEGAAVL